MSSPLFRNEVLAHRQGQAFGGIVLMRPPAFGVVCGVAVLLAAAVGGFLCWADYTRTARVSGLLVPAAGIAKLVSAQGGVVLEQRVEEGGEVAAGDVVFVVSGEQASLQGGTQTQVGQLLAGRRESLRQDLQQLGRLEAQRRQAMRERLQAIATELARLDGELGVQRQRTESSRDLLARHETLRREGFMSELQVQLRRDDALEQQGKLAALERARASLLREQRAAEAEAAQLPTQMRREAAQVERSVGAIEQEAAENEARRVHLVKAPQAGVVTAVQSAPGQALAPGTVLASVVPAESALEVQLYAPSRAMGFVRPGQAVWLRYHAFPYQQFGQYRGTVKALSRAAVAPGELPATVQAVAGLAGAEPVYRIVVGLERQTVDAYGETLPLVPGMMVEADVRLDTHRLIEWVLEPLRSWRGPGSAKA